jgi:uncharacterized protein YndB with AHSA1/START domain
MAAIVASVDISRRPEEVFSYVTDPVHHPEWQQSVASAHRQDHGPLAVGSKAVVVRQVGRRQTSTTVEIVRLDPPRRWSERGIDGPVRGIVDGTIEPLDDGTRSRVTLALDFEAHGIGKLLVPLVIRRAARNQISENEQRLKHTLEQRT